MTSITTVATYGRAGSSARVRIFDWLDHLGVAAREHVYADGADNRPATLVRHLGSVARAEMRLRRLAEHLEDEVLLMSRRASPFSRGTIEETLLRRAGRGVFDFDDTLHLPDPGRLRRALRQHELWRRAVAAADVVIAGNEWLAEVASEHAGRVVMIPSCVEPDDYPRKVDYGRSAPPRAVWIGSPSTEGYLRSIEGPLLVAHRATGLTLTVISFGSRSLGALDRMVARRAWHPDTFASTLASHDFGIMPLTDDPWARGKCAYKLLQYGAAGLPTVGSPVGANAQALERIAGLAPRTTHDWTEALVALSRVSSASARRLGDAARAGVEEHYSFAAWQRAWSAAVGVGAGV